MVFGAIQFPSWYNCAAVFDGGGLVFGAIQFPSWYNWNSGYFIDGMVFGAIQFPSWYNYRQVKAGKRTVFGAIQFPSWYNGPSRRGPLTGPFLLLGQEEPSLRGLSDPWFDSFFCKTAT